MWQQEHDLTNSDDLSATSITTATASAAIIMFGLNADNEAYSNWNTTSPGSLTEIYDITYNAGLDMSIGAAWAIKAAAGNTGTGTAELSSNDAEANGAILIALRQFQGSITTNTITGSPFCQGKALQYLTQSRAPLAPATYSQHNFLIV
ncbi:MAG: hypothetical protein IPN33_23965 [Saprospiraceae bacterium]|nr:hypothetical protein [Saprospiraceae bacterium]